MASLYCMFIYIYIYIYIQKIIAGSLKAAGDKMKSLAFLTLLALVLFALIKESTQQITIDIFYP